MKQVARILSKENLTHDVLRIIAEKPSNLIYQPGQAVDVSINQHDWEAEIRPFTFTSLPEDEFVEFTIKTYPSHKGVTNHLLDLHIGEELIIGEVFGDIHYKGEGIFIAGGAGVTPFIAILKHLEKENKIGNNQLIFANKTKADIILEDKFQALLGDNFINVLSDDKIDGYENGYITEEIIKKHMTGSNQYFYLCGPEPMMNAVEKQLNALGVTESYIVKEAF